MEIYLKKDLEELKRKEDGRYIVIGKIDKSHRSIWGV